MNVLVAGAGPVGLSAATALEAAGVAVTVLEAEPRLPENLRASTFQPPTLDLLDRFGAAQKLIEMGRIARKVQYRDRAGWVAELDFGVLAGDTNHPYRVQCEQYKLNQVLAARLRDVRFNAEVVDVLQESDGVVVTLASGEKLKGSYLIGADGGRSRVREAIGVRLEGFTWPERFLVASTPFAFEEVIPRLSDVSYFADPEEWFFLLRVRGLWRVMFPTREEEKETDILSDTGVQARLQRVFPGPPYEIRHRTLYGVHQRVAESYRKGRVFLAGDAAHLNNPLGGMGMNGGIHDAFNLAEKLLSGDLDAYERQRRPVALEYVNTITIANKRNLEMRDAGAQERWRAELARAMADRAAEREYMLKISMIASLRKYQCA
jgi:3-(3-hydroxy-phenyl)propionate hydroxylase